MSKILNKLSSIFNRRSTGELKIVTGAIDSVISTADSDLVLLQLQYIIGTSTGEWLDEWGSWFGCTRNVDEADLDYSARILATATQPKSTIPAIVDSVNNTAGYTGSDTKAFEPHTLVAKHNVSQFSGNHRYQDGTYWKWNVVEIQTPFVVSDATKKLIDSVKAGGTKVFYSIKVDLEMPPPIAPTIAEDLEVVSIFEPSPPSFMSGETFCGTPADRFKGLSGNRTLWGVNFSYFTDGIDNDMTSFARNIWGSPCIRIDQIPSMSPAREADYQVDCQRDTAVVPGSALRGSYAQEMQVREWNPGYTLEMKSDFCMNVLEDVKTLAMEMGLADCRRIIIVSDLYSADDLGNIPENSVIDIQPEVIVATSS